MKAVRAFFCLPLPDALLREAALWLREANDKLPGARWVTRRNLHVTLRFCGEISEQTAKALHKRLASPLCEALAAMPALTLEGTGTFGRPPRVLWAGLGGGVPQLRALNSLIEDACQAEGLEPDDKRFSPHLTLARFSDPRSARLDRLPPWTLSGSSWTPERAVFMRSTLTPAGPNYTPLAVYERSLGKR